MFTISVIIRFHTFSKVVNLVLAYLGGTNLAATPWWKENIHDMYGQGVGKRKINRV